MTHQKNLTINSILKSQPISHFKCLIWMHITNVTRRPSLQKEDTIQIRFSPPDAPHSTVNSPLLFFLLLILIISLLLNYEMTKCLDTEVKKRLAVAAPILKTELYGLPTWVVSYTYLHTF